ncbi:hypothetical protein G7K_3653-t1 [Saitoella complicata NRRL Y-17804]|uniref:Uncharacterized protein n=1 Tax=Saitoella complicata (strain BCRC 22490 / CBS 7301 / JCM 7358 / NBRC 10748 / NRRL Y-17804) TaxID=698492 RepID=A0A0E9NI36_SAICN|nr:hypothetical protein G7K_3653-t1 [Saitoella complicata NRRL Y-17804]
MDEEEETVTDIDLLFWYSFCNGPSWEVLHVGIASFAERKFFLPHPSLILASHIATTLQMITPKLLTQSICQSPDLLRPGEDVEECLLPCSSSSCVTIACLIQFYYLFNVPVRVQFRDALSWVISSIAYVILMPLSLLLL